MLKLVLFGPDENKKNAFAQEFLNQNFSLACDNFRTISNKDFHIWIIQDSNFINTPSIDSAINAFCSDRHIGLFLGEKDKPDYQKALNEFRKSNQAPFLAIEETENQRLQLWRENNEQHLLDSHEGLKTILITETQNTVPSILEQKYQRFTQLPEYLLLSELKKKASEKLLIN